MPWNVLLRKVLNNFWYFKYQILTRVSSKICLRCNWRNCLWKNVKIQARLWLSKLGVDTSMGEGIICSPGWDRVKVATKTWCGHVPTSTCPQARLKLQILKTFLQLFYRYASEQILVKIWCLKYQKLFKTLIISRFQGMYCLSHKTATLTSIHCAGVQGVSKNQNLFFTNKTVECLP